MRMVCLNESPQATHAVDVTAFLDQGIASLLEHRTYLEHLATHTDPATFLRHNATLVGTRCGCQYAVSFEVFRL